MAIAWAAWTAEDSTARCARQVADLALAEFQNSRNLFCRDPLVAFAEKEMDKGFQFAVVLRLAEIEITLGHSFGWFVLGVGVSGGWLRVRAERGVSAPMIRGSQSGLGAGS